MTSLANLFVIISLVCLIGCAPSVLKPPPELEKIYNPKNLPDLRVRDIRHELNRPQRKVCFGATLVNNGDIDISGPFIVAIGVTYRRGPNGLLISAEKKVEVPPSVTIPKFGGEYATECLELELLYCTELGNLPINAGYTAYWIEIYADLEHTIEEINESNNYQRLYWCVER